MIEWFEALSVAGKVFVCVAVPSTLVLVIQTVMTFFGFGDGDGDADLPDLDGDGVPDGIFGGNEAGETDNFEIAESSGLHMFSLRGIVAFFCIFGWLGLTMVTNGTEEWLAVLIAFIGGFLAMLGVAFLLKVPFQAAKRRHDGHPLRHRRQRKRVHQRPAAAQREGEGEPAHTGQAGGAGRRHR